MAGGSLAGRGGGSVVGAEGSGSELGTRLER